MKIKIEDLLNKSKSIEKILKGELPFKLSYRLTKIATKHMQEMKHIEKSRTDMIKTIGNEQKDGSFKVEGDEQNKKWKDAWEDFIAQEIDFNIEKIPFDLLEEGGVRLSAYDVAHLECFLGEKPKEKKEKNR